MSAKKENTLTFIINKVADDDLDEFHWELSELTRKFPTANFCFKQNGKVSCPYEKLPILDKPSEYVKEVA